jgi:predicted regulator of Ras-like GTPase activity (Roadblock/LC7/MglB family)
MEQILTELNKTPEVLGSFIVSEDGMVVASDISTELEEELLGALSAGILRATGRLAEKVDQGDVQGIILETDKNKVFFQKSKAGFLVVVASESANLGLIRVEMRSAVSMINSLSLEAG